MLSLVLRNAVLTGFGFMALIFAVSGCSPSACEKVNTNDNTW